MSVSKKWLRPLFRVFARGWRRAAQRDAGPVPFFALAGCVDPGKESMAVRAQCLGGHIALPRRATERRPVVSTQAKRVWPSGHRTKENMAVPTRDFPDLFRAPGGVPAGTKCRRKADWVYLAPQSPLAWLRHAVPPLHKGGFLFAWAETTGKSKESTIGGYDEQGNGAIAL